MDREALVTERNNMLQILKQTDYIALKIAEGAATPAEYTEELALRATCRMRIIEIDAQLESV
jgi:hypothetical protein